MHILDDFHSAEKFLKKTLFATNKARSINGTWGIIPAGGSGRRFKSNTPKQYKRFDGKTVLEWSAESLQRLPRRASLMCIIIIISKEDKFCQYLNSTIEPNASSGISPTIALRCGGDTRSESVSAGVNFLENLASPEDWVVIHDAVRPCVSHEALSRLWDIGSMDDDGAILGIPVSETLKSISKPSHEKEVECFRIKKTVDRETFWLAQTPQMFKLNQLLEVFAKKNFTFTDEASAIESLGKRPRLVLGEKQNIKITTPEDFEIIKNWKRKKERTTVSNMMRFGQGFDIHKFGKDGNFVILGGVKIEHSNGLVGHSDADVLIHAICDALLGAAGLGDIGDWFPDNELKYKDIDSRKILKKIVSAINERDMFIFQIDATVICEVPKITPHKEKIKKILIKDTQCNLVNVKATTTETLGSIGRKEGIAALATASLCCK